MRSLHIIYKKLSFFAKQCRFCDKAAFHGAERELAPAGESNKCTHLTKFREKAYNHSRESNI